MATAARTERPAPAEGNRHAASRQRRRQQILDVAKAAFAERGYHDTSISDIIDSAQIDVVLSGKKVVDLQKYYNTERLRPQYKTLINQPLFIMTSDIG